MLKALASQREFLPTAPWWSLQLPLTSSMQDFELVSGFTAVRNPGCHRARKGSRSLAGFDFMLKKNPPNHATEPVPQQECARSQSNRGEEGKRAGLTHAERFLLEVLGQVGAAGDAVHVALQHVPTHLVIEGITKLIWDLQDRQEDLSGLLPTAALR